MRPRTKVHFVLKRLSKLIELRPNNYYHEVEFRIIYNLLYDIKIDKERGCWYKGNDWSRYHSIDGERAHRISYRLFVGPLPHNLLACHKCDRPGCIYPLHLFKGTNTDNRNDAIQKGRLYSNYPLNAEVKKLKNRIEKRLIEIDNWKQLRRFSGIDQCH